MTLYTKGSQAKTIEGEGWKTATDDEKAKAGQEFAAGVAAQMLRTLQRKTKDQD